MPLDAGLEIDAYLPRFGLKAFRPGQHEVIATVLSGRDCLCVMPTGGGKSLCYQLPAVVLQGLTLVVSPLIALMKDQVDQLHALGLPITFINSTLSLAEQYERLDRMAAGEYQLVYVVPERFRSSRFLEAVRAVGLKLLAIDEAHCISEWGHDFRPDYARLGKFRHMLGKPTTIALTATATDAVRRDIVEQLDLGDPRTFITGFARPNLFYQVQSPRGERQKSEMLLEFLRDTPGSGIIYTSSRKRTEEVAEMIAENLRRSTVVYHAGMLSEQRHAAQDAFMGGRAEIVVATNAFGMGIDKPDVRFVIHYNMPGTLEAYYQEAGRAGRDGDPSRCLLLYYSADRHIQEYFIENAYPGKENVALVYEYLCSLKTDPIQLTQQEIKEALELPIGAEGVGACEHLLESAGALERLVASQNMASVRLDSDLPTLVDLLPRQATVRRKVLRALEKVVGQRRNEMVYFHLRDLAAQTELDQSSITNALRELNNLDVFTYLPPFRGRAIRMLRRDVPFDKLEIDFETLQRRKQAEYEKLKRVVQFALSPHCRQQEILHYFGDSQSGACGHCDNCAKTGAKPRREPAPLAVNEKVVEAVRITLSGVARVSTRFPCGKNLIAQMLCGSNSAKMEKFQFNRLSTFGLLKHLTQPDVATLIDGLVARGLLQQVEFDAHRPVVQLTPAGIEVMKGTASLDGSLPIPAELLATLRGDRAQDRTAEVPAADSAGDGDVDQAVLTALRKWRSRQSFEEGIAPFMVFSNAVLETLARRRPQSIAALREVKGVGDAKIAKYGEAVLALVGRGASPQIAPPPSAVPAPQPRPTPGPIPTTQEEQEEEPPPLDVYSDEPPPEEFLLDERFLEESRALGGKDQSSSPGKPTTPERSGTQPAHYWTWRLLSAGFRVEECVAIRGLPREAILDHALRALEEGWPIRTAICFSGELLAALDREVGPKPPEQTRPLLAHLPAGTTHQEVQLYLKCRQQRPTG